MCFIWYLDFSSISLAAVCTKLQPDDKKHLIGCVVHKTTKSQSNYPRWKGELAALVLRLKVGAHSALSKVCCRIWQQIYSKHGQAPRWAVERNAVSMDPVHSELWLAFEHIACKNLLADSLSRVQGLDPPAEASRFDILHDDELKGICALRAKVPTNLIVKGQKADTVLSRIPSLITRQRL